MTTRRSLSFILISLAAALIAAPPSIGDDMTHSENCVQCQADKKVGVDPLAVNQLDESLRRIVQNQTPANTLANSCKKPLTPEEVVFLQNARAIHQAVLEGMPAKDGLAKLETMVQNVSHGDPDREKLLCAQTEVMMQAEEKRAFIKAADHLAQGGAFTVDQKFIDLMRTAGFDDPAQWLGQYVPDLRAMRAAGAKVVDGNIDLSHFQFEKLKNPELKKAFLMFFPDGNMPMTDSHGNSTTKIAMLADPKRSVRVIIGDQVAMPPLYKQFKPGVPFVAAMPLAEYSKQVEATLKKFDINTAFAVRESKEGGTYKDVFRGIGEGLKTLVTDPKNAFSASDPHAKDDFKDTDLARDRMLRAQKRASQDLEDLTLKFGIGSAASHDLLNQTEDMVKQSDGNMDKVTSGFAWKQASVVLAPLAELASPGALLLNFAIAGGGIGISAGVERYKYGGDFLCRYGEQLADKGPQAFATSVAFAGAAKLIGTTVQAGSALAWVKPAAAIGGGVVGVGMVGYTSYGAVKGGVVAHSLGKAADQAEKDGNHELALAYREQSDQAWADTAQNAAFAFAGTYQLVSSKLASMKLDDRMAAANKLPAVKVETSETPPEQDPTILSGSPESRPGLPVKEEPPVTVAGGAVIAKAMEAPQANPAPASEGGGTPSSTSPGAGQGPATSPAQLTPEAHQLQTAQSYHLSDLAGADSKVKPGLLDRLSIRRNFGHELDLIKASVSDLPPEKAQALAEYTVSYLKKKGLTASEIVKLVDDKLNGCK